MKSLTVNNCFFLFSLMFISSAGSSQNNDNRIFDPSSLTINEIGTNSIHSDFGPTLVDDSLYFTTFNDELKSKSDQKLRKKEFYDLYKAEVDQQGNASGKRIPIQEFITKYNDGPLSWCAETGELFITRNYDDQSGNLKPFQNILNRLRIYVAKKIDGQWVRINDFPWNNPQYSVGHPAVTASGDTLVFSSDKPGGYGKTDLYYSVRKNGKWGSPVNLGPKINTSEKEEFAFITDKLFNGRFLIFSSARKPGESDLDLYYTKFPSDFSEITRFDKPVNSEFDDFAMSIPSGKEYGYLTSNRPGTGSDDIYKFTFRKILKVVKSRELYVYDINSRHPIPGARITSCEQNDYLTDAKGKIDSLSCNEVACKVLANAFGYYEKSQLLTSCSLNVPVTRDTIWMKIVENEKIVLQNIYYDFDKWNILPEASKELDRLVSLMMENPKMKVDLSSHTDERGSDIYNMKLSNLRAASAIGYIVSKGIDSTRITGKGFGKTQLIHKRIGGQNITPEQDRENRRTEIFIPGFLRGEPVKQYIGDYSNGMPDHTVDSSSNKEHGSLPGRMQSTAVNKKLTNEYYLILGSFNDQVSASRFVGELKVKGYEALIIGEINPFRVGCKYDSLSKAKKALADLKPDYSGVWILRN